MVIFGTLGIFVNQIPLPSVTIVMVRAIVGTVFVAALMLIKKQPINVSALKQNRGLLLASGIALGFNWALLFEAYRYTTVAVATLCYYMAPVFLMLLSPIVLKEPMTHRKALCIFIAVTGAVLVSGAAGGASMPGVLLGLGAAALYCAIMLMNRKMQGLNPVETTLVQLAISAVVITPYVFLSGGAGGITPACLPWLAVVGIVHTGIAYVLYFPSINVLPSQTVAVLSYIDPILAILLSALILRQPMTAFQALGAALLLGGTFISEWKKGEE